LKPTALHIYTVVQFTQGRKDDFEARVFPISNHYTFTHCRFTFAPRPSVAVSFKQGSRLMFSGYPYTVTLELSSENY